MEICPFRGIRYNQEIVRDLASVICPPYDVVTPEQQNSYYRLSNYNAIRLELPPEQPGDNNANNKYSRAAIILQQWLKQGVLRIDDYSAFYLHDHYFNYMGEERRRRGLIARVKLEPWGTNIYPHEETFSKAKGDRLKLMRACRANFSPLFSLYQDTEQKIASILAEVSQIEPIIDISVPSPSLGEGQGEGEKHVVWAITDPSLICRISHFLTVQPLYIADGHHRYETALAYQLERARRLPSVASNEAPNRVREKFPEFFGWNYIMMELVDFSDPGLVILPLYRLVRGIAPSTLAKLESQLTHFFTLEFVPLTEAFRDPFHVTRPRIRDRVLGILGLKPQSLVALKQRQGISIESVTSCNRSQAYKEFSVSLLNHIILDKMLEVTANKSNIAYTVDLSEAYQQIKEGKYQLAFLLNPPQPGIVKAVVNAKDRLPRKSTYFYPKLPAGLIITPLD